MESKNFATKERVKNESYIINSTMYISVIEAKYPSSNACITRAITYTTLF